MKYYAHLMLMAGALALSGCGTAGALGGSSKSKSGDGVSSAMASAARDAAGKGNLHDSLMINEKLYQGDPDNTQYIIAYARDLRRAGKIDDAKLVIRTPAKKAKAKEPILTECAMVLIASGEYNEAQTFAQNAVNAQENSPDAHQALALALSGLGDHVGAQYEFQHAMDLWPEGRDKTSVINNLAMSLAAQGKISEAKTTMALATGQALESPTYQNNRALLNTLEDAPRAEVLPLKDGKKPAKKGGKVKPTGMKPILED